MILPLRLGLIFIVWLTLVGCYPVTRMNVPNTLDPGQVQFAMAVAAQAVGGSTGLGATPEIAVRVGVAADLELGVRARVAAVEAGAKYQIARGSAEVSFAPSLLVAEDTDIDALFDEWQDPDASASVVALRNAVYVGTSSKERVSAWIAPSIDLGSRVLSSGYRNDGISETFAALGVCIGVVFAAASESSRPMIELGLLVPVGGPGELPGEASDVVQSRLGPGDVRIEGSVGIAFR